MQSHNKINNIIDFSIIIPAFNEQNTINLTHQRLSKFINNQPFLFELIYVDDGSKDKTLELLAQHIGQNRFPLTVVKLTGNFGQHQAVIAGMSQACGKYIITCDADLQSPPQAMKILIQAIQSGDMIVSGWRENRNDKLLRKMYSFILNRFLSYIFNQPIRDIGSMLKIYRDNVVKDILDHQHKSSFIPVLALKLGYRIKEIPTPHSSRKNDQSKYSFTRLLKLYSNLLSEFSPPRKTRDYNYQTAHWIIKSLPEPKSHRSVFLVGPYNLSTLLKNLIEYLRKDFNVTTLFYHGFSEELSVPKVFFLDKQDINRLIKNFPSLSKVLAFAEISQEHLKFHDINIRSDDKNLRNFKISGNIDPEMINSLVHSLNTSINENYKQI